MKIGIISDSHDHHKNVLKATDVFNRHKVEYVFHAGDIVSPFTAKTFAAINNAKFIAVFGNCDGERLLLSAAIKEFGGEVFDDCYMGKIDGKRIFMTHRPSVINEVAGSGNFDIVIHGHTHKPEMKMTAATMVINPGESTDWLTGQSHIVVVDLDGMRAQEIEL